MFTHFSKHSDEAQLSPLYMWVHHTQVIK